MEQDKKMLLSISHMSYKKGLINEEKILLGIYYLRTRKLRYL
jgi:hypothetical protein